MLEEKAKSKLFIHSIIIESLFYIYYDDDHKDKSLWQQSTQFSWERQTIN